MSFVEIGNFKLPGGKGGEVMMTAILNYLDIQSLCSFIETSIIKQMSIAYGNSEHLMNTCEELIRLEKEKLDAVTSFTISRFAKAICDNFEILEELLEKYEAPDERIWLVDECEACLHPSTVEAIYAGGHCDDVYNIILEGGYEYGDDISEEYEDFPQLREGECIPEDGNWESEAQFGDQTVTEFCKEYGIPEDEMLEVLSNCIAGDRGTHEVYIEKTLEKC